MQVNESGHEIFSFQIDDLITFQRGFLLGNNRLNGLAVYKNSKTFLGNHILRSVQNGSVDKYIFHDRYTSFQHSILCLKPGRILYLF